MCCLLACVVLILSVVRGSYGVCSLLLYVVLVMSVVRGNYGVCSLLQYVVLIMSVVSDSYGVCCLLACIQLLGTHSVLSFRAGDCDFQTGFCQWTEDSSGTQQWVQGSGQSHTNNSAPLFDHDGSSTGNLPSICMLVEGGDIVPQHQPCSHGGQIIMHSTGQHSIT